MHEHIDPFIIKALYIAFASQFEIKKHLIKYWIAQDSGV